MKPAHALGLLLVLPAQAVAQDCDFGAETVTRDCLQMAVDRAYSDGLHHGCQAAQGTMSFDDGRPVCTVPPSLWPGNTTMMFVPPGTRVLPGTQQFDAPGMEQLLSNGRTREALLVPLATANDLRLSIQPRPEQN